MTLETHIHKLIAIARLHTEGLTHVAELAQTSRSNLLGMNTKEFRRPMPKRVKSGIETALGFDEKGFKQCKVESWLARKPSDITQLIALGFRLKPLGRVLTASEAEGRHLYQYLVLQVVFEETARIALVRMTLDKVDELLNELGSQELPKVVVPNALGKALMSISFASPMVQDDGETEKLLGKIVDFATKWEPVDVLAAPQGFRMTGMHQIHGQHVVDEIYEVTKAEERRVDFIGKNAGGISTKVLVNVHASTNETVVLPWAPGSHLVLFIVYQSNVFQIAYDGPIDPLLDETQKFNKKSLLSHRDKTFEIRSYTSVTLHRVRELGMTIPSSDRLQLRRERLQLRG
jgi:hypothetical protein